jgi:hypothetical protein
VVGCRKKPGERQFPTASVFNFRQLEISSAGAEKWTSGSEGLDSGSIGKIAKTLIQRRGVGREERERDAGFWKVSRGEKEEGEGKADRPGNAPKRGF